MSIIFQDYGQYQMTARENIGLSRTDKLDEDAAIERASEKSGAVEVVNDLPERYDTMLGRLFPGGRQLSGGQWQRLALGRLYFRPASVQIFDEPTAALDAIAEAAMIDRLARARRRSHHAADFAPLLDRPNGRDHRRAPRGDGCRGRAPSRPAGKGRHLRHALQPAGTRISDRNSLKTKALSHLTQVLQSSPSRLAIVIAARSSSYTQERQTCLQPRPSPGATANCRGRPPFS